MPRTCPLLSSLPCVSLFPEFHKGDSQGLRGLVQGCEQRGEPCPLHREELQSVQRELEVLSEQYSQKCLENAHLAQALEAERQALRQCQRENQELNAHNQVSLPLGEPRLDLGARPHVSWPGSLSHRVTVPSAGISRCLTFPVRCQSSLQMVELGLSTA